MAEPSGRAVSVKSNGGRVPAGPDLPKDELSLPDQRELVADYLPYCTVVPLPESPPLETFDCRDPFDLPFLHLAAAGKAEVLLTGDSDLLSLNGTFVCSIVTADHFRGVIDTRA